MHRNRETDWAQNYPQHAVSEWIGHSIEVSASHYLTVPEELYRKVSDGDHSGDSKDVEPEIRLGCPKICPKIRYHDIKKRKSLAYVSQALFTSYEIGVTRFELAASWSRTKRSTKLEPSRYCYRQPLKLVRLPIPPPTAKVKRRSIDSLLRSGSPAEETGWPFLLMPIVIDCPAIPCKINQTPALISGEVRTSLRLTTTVSGSELPEAVCQAPERAPGLSRSRRGRGLRGGLGRVVNDRIAPVPLSDPIATLTPSRIP